jgi:3-hydroxyisobutyrate dehydrogenase-like beta-hydroxyacid dehydrogenase
LPFDWSEPAAEHLGCDDYFVLEGITTMSTVRQRCGVIGMGMIGAGAATCLVRKDRLVVGYDVRPEAIAQVKGVKAAGSPAEVARQADVILLAVVNADQARSALFGAQGIADAAHSNLIVALMSTVRVPLVLELAAEAAKKGFKLIDCAITTGGVPVSEGSSAVMLGGDKETIESVRSVMEDFTVKMFHMGPLGAGMAAKVARNVMHYLSALGAYEGGKLAEAAGVDIKTLIDVVRSSDPHNLMSTVLLERRGTTKPLGDIPDNVREQFRGWAGLLHKDIDAALDLASAKGVKLPGAELAQGFGESIYGLEQK